MLIGQIVLRLILLLVFAIAGVAKLSDREGSRKALIGFGIRARLAKPLAIILPAGELAVAALLLFVASAGLGALGALGLLLTFVAAIGINLAQGREPDCHCFGQLHSAPAGRSTLLRNIVLACGAGILVWQTRYRPSPSLFAWFSALTISQRAALTCALVGIGFLAAQLSLLLQIVKQQGRILLRLDTIAAPSNALETASSANAAGLSIGSRAPDFRLRTLAGDPITLDNLLLDGKPLLLLFTNPKCGPCQALLPEVSEWQREYRSLTIALVTEGTAADNQPKAAEYSLSHVLLQDKREVAEMYHAWGTPAAVLVQADGIISSAPAQGTEAIRALVYRSVTGKPLPRVLTQAVGGNGLGTGTNAHLRAPKLGDYAPALKLRDLYGTTVVLSAFHGRPTLILFWNPRCGFCQQMLSDLRDWDAARPAEAPELFVISTGTAEEGQAMRLRAPVLIDETGHVPAAFGAGGTPHCSASRRERSD